MFNNWIIDLDSENQLFHNAVFHFSHQLNKFQVRINIIDIHSVFVFFYDQKIENEINFVSKTGNNFLLSENVPRIQY